MAASQYEGGKKEANAFKEIIDIYVPRKNISLEEYDPRHDSFSGKMKRGNERHLICKVLSGESRTQ